MHNDWLNGEVISFSPSNGYGYISSPDRGQILVHSRSLGLGVTKEMIKPGITVRFKLDEVRTGLIGRMVTPLDAQDSEQHVDLISDNSNNGSAINDLTLALDNNLQNGFSPKASPRLSTDSNFLGAALLYKEQKNWARARSTYQEGIQKAPTLTLVLSFAAFEKSIGNLDAAKKVYLQGMKIFPENQKLHEDAGSLELKQGDPKLAIDYFTRALELFPPLGSKANIHGWLGTLYYRLAVNNYSKIDKSFLNKAKENFEKANKLRGLTQYELNLYYKTCAIIIKMHSAFMFHIFEKSGFKITQLFKPDTHHIDFIIDPQSEELRTTYALEEPIYVRLLLIDPNVTELSKIDEETRQLAKFEFADPHLAFLVTDKSARPLMNALKRRLESGGRNTLIIPLELQSFIGIDSYLTYFRELLNQWLFRRDLYQDNFPVSGSLFFGRELQLKSLFTSVSQGRHVGIFGLRKVGKTSFLWRVRDRSASDLVAYVDLLAVPAAVKTCNYIYWLIGNELEADFRLKYPGSSTQMDFQLFGKYPDFLPLLDKPVSLLFDSDLNRLRRSLSAVDTPSPTKIIVLIDEVERLLPIGTHSSGFEGFFDFFSYWRGQAQLHRDLVTVITGANPAIAEQAQWEGFDNPVYKFYHEEFLPPLEFKECAQMLSVLGAGMGVSYTDKALEKIFTLTGGLPFISRLLASRICKARPARPLRVDHRMVEEDVPKFMLESFSLFDEIIERLGRDFPLELKALEVIARYERVDIKKLNDELGESVASIVSHLMGYQLIHESRGNYSIGLELLRNYINNISK